MITGLELASSIVYGNPKCDVSLYITYNTEENKKFWKGCDFI